MAEAVRPVKDHHTSPAPSVDLNDPQWAPFLRSDRYGTYGQTPQPVWERIRLALAAVTLAPLRVVLTLTCIIGLSLSTRLCYLLPKNSLVRARAVAFFCRFWAGSCCKVLGFHRTWVKVPPFTADVARGHGTLAPCGIVSNHVSHPRLVAGILYTGQLDRVTIPLPLLMHATLVMIVHDECSVPTIWIFFFALHLGSCLLQNPARAVQYVLSIKPAAKVAHPEKTTALWCLSICVHVCGVACPNTS